MPGGVQTDAKEPYGMTFSTPTLDSCERAEILISSGQSRVAKAW
jgi:hypothetical protein